MCSEGEEELEEQESFLHVCQFRSHPNALFHSHLYFHDHQALPSHTSLISTMVTMQKSTYKLSEHTEPKLQMK